MRNQTGPDVNLTYVKEMSGESTSFHGHNEIPSTEGTARLEGSANPAPIAGTQNQFGGDTTFVSRVSIQLDAC